MFESADLSRENLSRENLSRETGRRAATAEPEADSSRAEEPTQQRSISMAPVHYAVKHTFVEAATHLFKHCKFLPGFFIYLLSTVVSSTGAHGFVHASLREPFGENEQTTNNLRRGGGAKTCAPSAPSDVFEGVLCVFFLGLQARVFGEIEREREREREREKQKQRWTALRWRWRWGSGKRQQRTA